MEPPAGDVADARRGVPPAATTRWRAWVAGGSVGGGSSWADRSVGGSVGAPLLGRRGRRVLRRGGCRSLAATTTARAASAARAPGGQRAHCARSTATPPPDKETASDSTVLLCCSGSRSPAAVASLRRQAPTLLRRCGAGLAHSFHNWRRCWRPSTVFTNAGADVGGLRRCSRTWRRCWRPSTALSNVGADVGGLRRRSRRAMSATFDGVRAPPQAARRAVGRRPASRCASLSPWAA